MTTAIVTEDSGWWIVARCNIDGVVADFTQAAVSSVTWKAWSVTDPATITNSGTETVSQVVFDTLQTTLGIPDSTGYNLRVKFAASEFDTPGRYRVEVLISPASAEQFIVVDPETKQPPIIEVLDVWTS